MDAAEVLQLAWLSGFSWTIQLKNPKLEVLLTIMGDAMTVAIALNHESKYKRTNYTTLYCRVWSLEVVINVSLGLEVQRKAGEPRPGEPRPGDEADPDPCFTVIVFCVFHIHMYRMADIQSGDVVVDPMCGGGSIGIEVCVLCATVCVCVCVCVRAYEYKCACMCACM